MSVGPRHEARPLAPPRPGRRRKQYPRRQACVHLGGQNKWASRGAPWTGGQEGCSKRHFDEEIFGQTLLCEPVEARFGRHVSVCRMHLEGLMASVRGRAASGRLNTSYTGVLTLASAKVYRTTSDCAGGAPNSSDQ